MFVLSVGSIQSIPDRLVLDPFWVIAGLLIAFGVVIAGMEKQHPGWDLAASFFLCSGTAWVMFLMISSRLNGESGVVFLVLLMFYSAGLYYFFKALRKIRARRRKKKLAKQPRPLEDSPRGDTLEKPPR